MKRIIIIAAFVIGLASCNRPYDTVFSTYKDGTPKLVFTVLDGKAGQLIRVGEKQYYEDGTLQYEKHFKDDQPNGTWTFNYSNGKPFAVGQFAGDSSSSPTWVLYDENGADLGGGNYDSLVVLSYSADRRPLSVAYVKGNEEMHYRFNDNYSLNAKGKVVGGKKEGRWEFYYANGQKMLEAIYIGDKENGIYNSYRENGIPYFMGFYINGERAGVWEFYDADGNPAGKRDFDSH